MGHVSDEPLVKLKTIDSKPAHDASSGVELWLKGDAGNQTGVKTVLLSAC